MNLHFQNKKVNSFFSKSFWEAVFNKHKKLFYDTVRILFGSIKVSDNFINKALSADIFTYIHNELLIPSYYSAKDNINR